MDRSLKGQGMSRRDFLRTGATGAAALATCARGAAAAGSRERPKNLIFIHTDQQSASALSAHGCKWVRTPNMDRLAARGVSFTSSYSANPVCCPARAAWYTGRPSTENGVVMNDRWPLVEDMPDLGQWFTAHGYESVYAGKWHVTGRPLQRSFSLLTHGHGIGEHGDATVTRAAEGFLRGYRGDKPFFLSLGYLQPHDICYWLFRHTQLLDELPYPAIRSELPPLPTNWLYDEREPETFKKHWRSGPAWEALEAWKPWQWRYYLWAYYRHVEMVDAHIGRVLDGLEDSRFADDTVVVFTADHGDGSAHHKMRSKMFFYDEAARVPMIVHAPDRCEAGTQDRTHLVSGLDVAPTLCDYAGIPAPPKARGRSLRPLVEGQGVEWREFLVAEAHRIARMVRTPEHKLIVYEGDSTDQLFDMQADPAETRNLAAEGSHHTTVSELKRLLTDWEGHLEPAILKPLTT